MNLWGISTPADAVRAGCQPPVRYCARCNDVRPVLPLVVEFPDRRMRSVSMSCQVCQWTCGTRWEGA